MSDVGNRRRERLARVKDRRDHNSTFMAFLAVWRMVEAELDQCIVEIYKNHGGREIDEECPVTLERKLRFLERACNEKQSLSDASHFGMRVVSNFRSDKFARNMVVHGWYEPESNQYLLFKIGQDKLVIKTHTFGPKGWDRLMDSTMRIFASLTLFRAALGMDLELFKALCGSFGELPAKLAAHAPLSEKPSNVPN